jgi:large subunit ribosomal protein L23
MNPYSVLLRPIVSEKSSDARDFNNCFQFHVAPTATKTEIKTAVETLWGVKVAKVNTLLQRGKLKRRGRYVALSDKRKKAMVTLAEGQTLPLFEEQ